MPFSRRQILTTTGLTLGCVAVYAALRMAPVEPCEFMHYGDYVNAEGVIEGCGYEEVGFFDLEALRFPLIAKVEALTPPAVGTPTLFQLSLQTSTGRPVAFEDLAVSHTERLHAMVVDPSLEDYQHIHPRDGGAPGTYTFEMTPHAAGAYQVFLDFIPLQTSRRSLLATSFEVPGEAGSVAVERRALEYSADDFHYALEPLEGGGFQAGVETRFRLAITPISENSTAPMRFDPVMDSYAHVVAFAAGRQGFAHFHPLNPLIQTQDPTNPDLTFAFAVDTPGHYRVWAQLSINGEERFIPFDLQVAES